MLFYEKSTAFEHELWDRWEYIRFLSSSLDLQKLDAEQSQNLGYALVQDAFYALSGCVPKVETPLGRAWERLICTDGFIKAQGAFKTGPLGRYLAVTEILSAISISREEQEQQQEESPQPEGVGVYCNDDSAGEDSDGTLMLAVNNTEMSLIAGSERIAGFDALFSLLEGEKPAKRLDAALAIQEAQKLDMFMLAELLGWAQRTVGDVTRHTAATEELVGYGVGQWDAQVTQTEMLAVADCDLYALARFADGALARRSMSGKRPAGRGPVVVLRDESLSMQEEINLRSPSGTTRHAAKHMWAQCLEIALAAAFNAADRELVGLAWSARGWREHTYGQPGFEKYIAGYLGGLTRVEPALTRAMELVRQYQWKADILIITDGMLQTSGIYGNPNAGWAEFVKDFRDAGGRVWALVVDLGDSKDIRERLSWTDGYVIVGSVVSTSALSDLVSKMTSTENLIQRV